jgi:hypothetical protein
MHFIKKHITLIFGVMAAIAMLWAVLYIRGRISNIKNKVSDTELAREPTLDAESKKQEYDVANVTTSEIFFGQRMSGADSSDTAPSVLPQDGAEASKDGVPDKGATQKTKQGDKKNASSGGSSAAAPKKAPTSTSTYNAERQTSSGNGALEELERREQAAAAAARREADAKIAEERKRREEAELKAAALEEASRQAAFSFVVVEGRYHRSSPPQDNRTKSQDKELLYTAKIYGTQRVKTGDPLTLRSTENIPFGSRVIPAASILYGIASQNGNRMHITLTSAITREGKYAISLSVYDHDMVRGIYLKDYEDIAQDNAAESTIDEMGSAVPNRFIGSVTKATTKQVQRSLSKQQKLTITLEDEYEVYIAVPQK